MKTRCECRNLSFAGLLSYARRHGITTIEALIEATGCCTGCGSCRPYLEELLRSGRLPAGDQRFPLPLPPESAPRTLQDPVQQGEDQQENDDEKGRPSS